MRKWLFAIFALLIANPVQASLWTYYDGNLPSIEERAEIAQEAGIVSSQNEYIGSYDQNIALEQYLTGGYPISTGGLFGAFRPSNYKTTLAASLTATASTTENIKVSSISVDGTTLTDAMVGDYIVLVINPGSGNEERVACSGGTLTSGTSVYWESCTRGLNRYDANANSARLKAHSPGETVIISNDDAFLSTQYTANDDSETITGLWTFNQYPVYQDSSTNPTSTAQFVPKFYVDNLTNQGAATSTESLAGIAQLATQLEMASSTFDVDAPTVLYTKYATSTPTVTGLYIPVSENDGKLNQAWFDLSESWAFTGTTTFATSTITDLTVTSSTISTLTVSDISGVAGIKKSFTAGEAITAGEAVIVKNEDEALQANSAGTNNANVTLSVTPGATDGYGQSFTTSASAAAITTLGFKTGTTVGGATVVTLELFATSGGLPTGSALGSATVTVDSANTDYTATFSSPVAVSPSTVYAIYPTRANTNQVDWARDSGEPYADGQALQRSGGTWGISGTAADGFFKVYEITTLNPIVYLADASSNDVYANNFIGFADENISQGSAGNITLQGYDDNQTGLIIGDTYYLSDTSGAISNSAGSQSRVIGRAISTTEIKIINDF